jgi:hypothetical protein
MLRLLGFLELIRQAFEALGAAGAVALVVFMVGFVVLAFVSSGENA